jgi:hypothetical protein
MLVNKVCPMTTQPTELPRFGALKALPPGYRLAERLRIDSPRTFLLLNLFSLLPFAVGVVFFYGINLAVDRLGLRPQADLPAGVDVWSPLVLLVLFVAMIVIHELCHGFAFMAFGAHPRYGLNLKMGVAYAAAPDDYLTRSAYIVVALAPLVVISIGSIILMALTAGGLRFLIALFGVINAGSAVGDLWFFAVILRHPPTLLVRDVGDGAELYVPATHRSDS